jgi:putative transposase
MLKAYKYRIYPNKEQITLIEKHFGCSRFIYNYALAQKTSDYQTTGKSKSKFEIVKEIPLLKANPEMEWLKEVNSQTLQASVEHLDRAFTKFFREKKGYPKFKSKKDNRKSFSIPQNTKVNFECSKISIPKFKGIKAVLHRKFEGDIKSSTISKTPTNKYFISILVEDNKEIPKKKPISEKQAIGIDLGIKTFATLSNGTVIENPKNLGKLLDKLKFYQRIVSRRVKGGSNRKKAVLKLSKVHEKITNSRLDFLNKTTHYLVNNYDTICLETLSVENMLKSGNNDLSRQLSDVAIGKFNEMMDYKFEWYGTNIIRIGRFEPSSKLCTCGQINNDLKLSDRIWTCNNCKATHNRDELASNNIKRMAFSKNSTVGIIGTA